MAKSLYDMSEEEIEALVSFAKRCLNPRTLMLNRMRDEGKVCEYCKYRSNEFSSVCVNRDSPKCSDFVGPEDTCEAFKEKE